MDHTCYYIDYNGIARLVNMGADTENLFMALIIMEQV